TVMIPPPGAFDLVIFTSQAAIMFFPDAPAWLAKKVCAVGEATAAAARAAGFRQVIQTGDDAADLKRYLAGATFGPALHSSAEDVAHDLSADFPGRVERIVTYRMRARTELPAELVGPISSGCLVLAPLFSRRSAIVLADLLNKAGV